MQFSITTLQNSISSILLYGITTICGTIANASLKEVMLATFICKVQQLSSLYKQYWYNYQYQVMHGWYLVASILSLKLTHQSKYSMHVKIKVPKLIFISKILRLELIFHKQRKSDIDSYSYCFLTWTFELHIGLLIHTEMYCSDSKQSIIES